MDLIQGMNGVVYGLVRVSMTSIRGRSVYTRSLCTVHSSLSSCLMLSGKVPAVCLYQEMDDALDQANY